MKKKKVNIMKNIYTFVKRRRQSRSEKETDRFSGASMSSRPFSLVPSGKLGVAFKNVGKIKYQNKS